jgi:hypothetical protein
MTVDKEIQKYRELIAYTQRQIDDLNNRYSGVRPSWVSGDIGMLCVDIDRYNHLIHQLQQEAK